MTMFRYCAVDEKGELCFGHLSVTHKKDLLAFLSSQHLEPVRITRQSFWQNFYLKHLHKKDLVRFFMYLDHGARAGQHLVAMLEGMRSCFAPRWSPLLSYFIEEISHGKSLSDSCQAYPSLFSPMIITILRLAENSGRFAEACGIICTYLENKNRHHQKLRRAIQYPLLSFVVFLGCLAFVHQTLVPELHEMFGDGVQDMPFFTRCLLSIPKVPLSGMFLGVLGIFFVVAVLYAVFYPRSKTWKEYVFFHFCPFGHYTAKAYHLSFLEGFRLLYEQNVPFIKAFELSYKDLNSPYLAQYFAKAQQHIVKGTSLCNALRTVPFLQETYVRFLQVGEHNSSLKAALVHASMIARNDLDHALTMLLERLGPYLLLIVGVFFLIVISGTLLPFYEHLGNLAHGQ